MHTGLPSLFFLFIAGAAWAGSGPPRAHAGAAKDKGTFMETLADSPSDILRAGGILWIRVQQADFGEALPDAGSTVTNIRKVSLKVLVKGIFKGTFTDTGATAFTLEASQRIRKISRVFAMPGVWSNHELAPGAEFVVFTRGRGMTLRDALSEGNCDHIFSAKDALEDVKLAADIEKNSQNLEETLRLAAGEAPKLDFQFAEYLWERAGANCLKNPAAYERLIHFLESPGLTYGMRSTLIGRLSSSVEGNAFLPSGYGNRLALAFFRMLALPADSELPAQLLDTHLPNLVGMHGGPAKPASEIFADHSADKTRAQEFLEHYRGTADAKPLLAWIRKP